MCVIPHGHVHHPHGCVTPCGFLPNYYSNSGTISPNAKMAQDTHELVNAHVDLGNVTRRHTWLCTCFGGLLAMYSAKIRRNNHSTTRNSPNYSNHTIMQTQNTNTIPNKSPWYHFSRLLQCFGVIILLPPAFQQTRCSNETY